jgi:hypothetical protein
MLFWVGILFAALIAWYAFRAGFYQSWAMLFNIVVSIYLAVFLGPVILRVIPNAADTPSCNVLAMLATAAAAFLILHCVSYTLMVGQFGVTFPRIFATLGSALLGFAAGFIVWAFACLLIYSSPLARHPFAQLVGFEDQCRDATVRYVSRCCNLVHRVVASDYEKETAEQLIRDCLHQAEEHAPGPASEPNEPATVRREEPTETVNHPV